ncbi:MAG: (d)CMP kinase [Bacillota bacterium]
MQKNFAIALDGPAGAGKSSVAKRIAHDLSIVYLDTGSMYRSVALFATSVGVDTQDADGLSKLMSAIRIEITHVNGEQRIFLDGVDVSDKIRTPEISLGASHVAVVPAVRIKMVEIQREIASKQKVIMDGRDIGTYVLPDADLKIYLTASVEERAQRRFDEMKEKGMQTPPIEEIMADIAFRDHNDSTREFAPLRKADDAIEIDSTKMTLDEVVAEINRLLRGLSND